MTRITGFNPPANIATLLGDNIKVNPGSKYASASAYPSTHKLKTKSKSMHWAHPLNFSEAARWMIEHGPVAWRNGSTPGIRTRIMASIANRTFDADLWTQAILNTDRIEVCYPEIDRGRYAPPDPLIPDDTANTDCDYYSRSTYWPYSQATPGGWPPLPGWQGEIDANRYFIDLWQAQRSLTYTLPPLNITDERQFVLLHLQGSITATASESGVRIWFPTMIDRTWHSSQSWADSYGDSLGRKWHDLADTNLVLPPAADGWSFTLPVNTVYVMRSTGYYQWTKIVRWFNLKLGTSPPRGVFRAANTWAKSVADVTPTVYYPAFIV